MNEKERFTKTIGVQQIETKKLESIEPNAQ